MGATVCCVHRDNDPFFHFITPNRHDPRSKCSCGQIYEGKAAAVSSLPLQHEESVRSDVNLKLKSTGKEDVQDSALPPLLYAYSLNHDMSPRDRLRLLGVRNSILNGLADSESGGYHCTNQVTKDVSLDSTIDARPQESNGEIARITTLEEECDDPCRKQFSLVVDPLIEIEVPPGDCGIVLDTSGNTSHLLGPPKVIGFTRKPNGSKGAIERSGLVPLGALLIYVDKNDLSTLTVVDALEIIQRSAHLSRQFVFTQ